MIAWQFGGEGHPQRRPPARFPEHVDGSSTGRIIVLYIWIHTVYARRIYAVCVRRHYASYTYAVYRATYTYIYIFIYTRRIYTEYKYAVYTLYILFYTETRRKCKPCIYSCGAYIRCIDTVYTCVYIYIYILYNCTNIIRKHICVPHVE